MANPRSSDVPRQVRSLFGVGTVAGLSDAQLLERFVAKAATAGEDGLAAEGAFEALVSRHGPMVLGVCRRALADPGDVEDAFQATFLVLVRRAASVDAGDSLGRWLYGVARRVAARVAYRSGRTRARSVRLAIEPAAPGPSEDRIGLMAALDEEMGRLPAKYRDPVILCHLEGLSHAEAAARLRWPIGTVSGRLSRARGLLKDRLIRRGESPTPGAMVLLLANGGARAAVPGHLAATTARAAARLSMGGASMGGAASSSALSLKYEVLRAAVVVKLRAAAILLAIALAGAAVAGAGRGLPGPSADPGSRRAPQAANAPAPGRPADEIVREIEAELKVARRPLSAEVWDRTHGRIASLVDELRAAHPDDPRVARFLPERWRSLNLIARRDEALPEIREALQDSGDPVLRKDALFVETMFRFLDPIDGPAAIELAESFARRAPGDNRAGELLYDAATRLDAGWYAVAGLASALVLLAGLIAATAVPRRWLKFAVRSGGLALLMLMVVLGGFRLLANDKLAAGIAFVLGKLDDAALRERVVWVASRLLGRASEQLRMVAATGRAGIAMAMAVVGGVALVVARRRFVGAPMRWTSRVRTALFGFTSALALACAVDAGLIALQGDAVRERVAREYPDSFRGRMVRGESRRRDRVGEPFELEFADAITGRSVSMKALRGKVVVVDFWATWCGPCIAEIDELGRLYRRYHDRGVEFIGVSLDLPEEDGGLEELRKFVADREIPWPQYYQGHDSHRVVSGAPTDDFSETWGISGIPTVFLIDAEGKLYSTEARGRLDALIPLLLEKSRAIAPGP